MSNPFAPSVVVSLDNLLHNVCELRARVPSNVKLIAVVKDCAYGCGALYVSKTLEKEGDVDFFAVANAKEAFALRSFGIRGDILVLGKADEEQLRRGTDENITFTCNDLDDLVGWIDSGIPVNFHCKIDTGMRRLGIQADEVSEFIDILKSSRSLSCKGVFTHFACADIPGTRTVERQYSLFISACEMLECAGIRPEHIHISNSAAVMRFPSLRCTHIRPGIALYGCKPDPAQSFEADLRPVLSLKGSVVSLRKVPGDTAVSYCGRYKTSSPTWIATIGMGYAHGIPRYLSNRGDVLIGGKRYRIRGNVTMDYIMVDAGQHPEMKIGDEAVVIGSQGDEQISADEVAIHGNTIGYEVLCNIGTSIERIYILNNKIIGINKGEIF